MHLDQRDPPFEGVQRRNLALRAELSTPSCEVAPAIAKHWRYFLDALFLPARVIEINTGTLTSGAHKGVLWSGPSVLQ